MFLFLPLQEKLAAYMTQQRIKQVAVAYLFAADAHESQTRSSGEPYITHPLAVAEVLADMHMDVETIMAALLHDVVEDTDVTIKDIKKKFGAKVAELVSGLTKLDKLEFHSKEEAQAENFRKMMLAMVNDIRVILIKLADRLHNMSTLDALAPHKRRRIALETLEIYAPIANRLGMHQFRNAFQDHGFRALHPLRYKVLKECVEKARGRRQKVLDKILHLLRYHLAEHGVNPASVVGREKRLYSIYRKMRFKGLPLSEIMDVYAFRIVAKDPTDCYRLLGVVHNIFKPVPGRFKDYVAIPKANGYQSLHTTLFGPHGVPIEIQIRTVEMNSMAENGIAAHWLYKSRGYASASDVKTREWLKNLLDMQQHSGSSVEFVENVKVDLYPDEVYVFTPRGDILQLPRGACPIDFAYAVHTEVGNHCVAAKIARKKVPLNHELVNGQTVEIITNHKATPSPSWLNFAATGKAKTAIKHFLKTQKDRTAVNLGKQLLNQALQPYKKKWAKLKPETREALLATVSLDKEDELFHQIGQGDRSAVLVAQQVMQLLDQPVAEIEASEALQIVGSEGMNLTFAQCCYPIPGDEVKGIVRSGAGIEVHAIECPILIHSKAHLKPDALVNLAWAETVAGGFPVKIRVEAQNKRGAIASIAAVIAQEDGDIRWYNLDEVDEHHAISTVVIEVASREHLAQLMKQIKKLEMVLRVYRVKLEEE